MTSVWNPVWNTEWKVTENISSEENKLACSDYHSVNREGDDLFGQRRNGPCKKLLPALPNAAPFKV